MARIGRDVVAELAIAASEKTNQASSSRRIKSEETLRAYIVGNASEYRVLDNVVEKPLRAYRSSPASVTAPTAARCFMMRSEPGVSLDRAPWILCLGHT